MRNPISFTKVILCLLVLSNASSIVDAAGPTTAAEASLNDLLAGTILSSVDNSFTFDQFALVEPVVGELPNLTIAADSDGSTTSLFFEFGEESRIFRAGEGYDITMEFRAHSTDNLFRLASSQLDMSGGAVGTSGSGRVELTETVDAFPHGPSIVLETFEAGNEPSMPIDNSPIAGGTDWAIRLRIKADGGAGTGSAAVLSDFTASFGTVPVPEPSFVQLSALGSIALVLGTLFHLRGRNDLSVLSTSV